ncbi:tyrosine-type recombinase/integrase [Avibacterium paragallinarum]|uniref:Tyrosine-type recombinase/integrase n=3 Tax=Avibacterium paragallinarum TaxID=728 RepID=A0AAE5WI43_AVIPA|nr:tyrosine-type recombinase/integrase [Avibacterium paragallinarum]MEE3608810.1 tyrosine-type recombinase/integrase [Avibacterium paragallinarum]MEE3620139.1 tyrosine-type recombinase/integrase [Avibacterium paragallinarum]MEE3669585.1 tyrosine-type recombinase/integrase [Avibacterium paragallinarum]MEE3681884.1 tyrosine-type recombinase/integrase [Avibacterium paragallinarum]MEE4385805.1 tyrosine-type recombinase/integrase [Avibacterium paragallinarum]
MTKINQTFINKLKPTGKEERYALGHKLFLVMTPKGSKSYRYIYRLPDTKAIRKKNLGRADVLSLEEALNRAISYNCSVSRGIDPIEKIEMEEAQLQLQKITLKEIADDWHKTKGVRLSEAHLKDRLARFNNHLFPILGDYAISDITLFNARELIKPIADKAPFMAEKVARDLRELGNHAVEMGILSNNHLLLIKQSFPRPKSKPNPCIKPEELPAFLKKLVESNLMLQTRLLIEFELLTMVRANEAASVEWDDIDFSKRRWAIPAEKMKMDKPHYVPLSTQAIEILRLLQQLNGNKKYVFVHRTDDNKHISSNTANQAFKRLGYKDVMIPHGMRSLAATYLEDIGAEAQEVINACLAHNEKSSTAKVYLRSNYYERRIPVMQIWGDYVEQCKRNR